MGFPSVEHPLGFSASRECCLLLTRETESYPGAFLPWKGAGDFCNCCSAGERKPEVAALGSDMSHGLLCVSSSRSCQDC